jgi:hypothetical protein
VAGIGKFVARVLLGFTSLVVSRALLELAHFFDWYPERDLARVLMASPTLLQIEWIQWGLLAILTVLLWGAADYVFYRRNVPARRARRPRRSDVISSHARPSAAAASSELEPNVDARVAFYEILANSEWSRQQRPGVDRPVSDWLARRLDQEIHNLLRQDRLKAWGHRSLTTTSEGPEREIPAEEWEDIEIDFAPLNPQLPRTSAMRRVRRGGFNTVYAGVRFARDQIYSRFPVIAMTATPAPGGVHPDWPIRELFFHIRPDLLENPNEAAWESVGNDLRDAFALNLVKVWGRPVADGIAKMLGEQPVLRLIESSYWHSAHFTFAFFDDTAGDAPHTYTDRESSLPEYTDLRVNRAEVLTVWRR